MPHTSTDFSIPFFGSATPQALLEAYGSPLYVYSEAVLRTRCRDLLQMTSHPRLLVNYSAKANTNPALLAIIRDEGCVVDAMSPGELALNLAAGFTPDTILYVCNNVSADEFRNAVSHGVLVSVDSLAQLERFGQSCPGAEVMIRLNPGIGAGHHQKVITAGKETKFGIDPRDMDKVDILLTTHDLRLAGVNQHIGSLFMEADAYINAVDVLLTLVTPLIARQSVRVIDFGGGFGIPYKKMEGQPRLDLARLGAALHERLSVFCDRTSYAGHFYIEPGRYIVAECGRLLGTVNATKMNGDTRYAGTDIGFNVLMRPIMYDSHHDIDVYRDNANAPLPHTDIVLQTVVGNICESGDILAKNRPLPLIRQGDTLAVLDAGAYGFVMASSYNQRPRPAEVLIGLDGQARLIRRRETLEDLTRFFV